MHADWYSKDNLPILPDENTIARKIIDEILNNVLKIFLPPLLAYHLQELVEKEDYYGYGNMGK